MYHLNNYFEPLNTHVLLYVILFELVLFVLGSKPCVKNPHLQDPHKWVQLKLYTQLPSYSSFLYHWPQWHGCHG